MKTHVQVIAWLNIILGALSLVAGLISMVFFGFIGILGASSGDPTPLPIFGAFGGLVFLILILTGLPSILVGIGLMNLAPWARIACIILSILHLANATTFGLSTILGIYSLIILFMPETERLFRRSY